ncbi:putative F-box protein At3g10240 [Corylus avellana]|uniref:putative F-box protein At3g10240 n=1 Tax=Corylus avellana TaxID=13451 RepID=UPI00286D0D4E|nr:putative F-box protein At3g10240 [Corylus avellana]
MSDFLPLELVSEILVRLPVKPLVRFRCVCKDWFSLISSNDFINTHINGALDGLLCLDPFDEREKEQSFSIWIMKGYGAGESWTKLFDIHISEGLRRVVAFRKSCEVLVTDRNGDLLSYVPENIKLVTQLGFRQFSSSGPKHLESLFLWDKYLEILNAKNGVSGGLANTSDSNATKG